HAWQVPEKCPARRAFEFAAWRDGLERRAREPLQLPRDIRGCPENQRTHREFHSTRPRGAATTFDTVLPIAVQPADFRSYSLRMHFAASAAPAHPRLHVPAGFEPVAPTARLARASAGRAR